MNVFAAEIRKMWTVRTTWVLTAMGWGLVALSSGATLLSEQFGVAPFTGSDEQIREVIGQIGGTAPIVLIVALLAMTTEFRHGTVGRTLQITPGRWRVLAAKLVGGVAYAAAFFATSLLVVALLLAVVAGLRDASLSLGSESLTALWQGPLGLALNAVLGVAVGALVRSQVVAITVALVWLFLVENLVGTLAPEVGRWMPFQALNALFVQGEMLGGTPAGAVGLLEPSVALVTFLAYVTVAAVAAAVLLRIRDV